MEILKKIFLVLVIISVWSYLTSIITEFILNRPMYSLVQLTFSIGILAYTTLCLNFIYRILTKNQNK